MKNILFIIFVILFISCTKGSIKPVSDLIKKNWAAKNINENNLEVFSIDGSNNIRQGYFQFKLNLSLGSVIFTDFDGTTFTGQWEISTDEKTLILLNLNPLPTGTNGQIEFSINSITDIELVLTRITANPKTGNTSTTYILTSN
ncbi:hypothetical protein EGI22_04100 [Lacihabitans sp. LS3-19]|uniref:hypothetical protein n=1 Tax=Lacihabitans sp. LS3-19 TaxID=2487335 RepID=UPI0020CC7529|nr:hypothetical protein [Lacihabitans sp. LS3-19]MCP9767079.1 hypothetical protein [Lacihabitans sp. LS3-19]